MEKVCDTVSETPVLSEIINLGCKTPPKIDEGSGNDLRKPSTPDRLRVPKAFKYPERYTSPTDLMVSPVTKGLLARGRRGGALLPPSRNQTKIHELRATDVGLSKNRQPFGGGIE